MKSKLKAIASSIVIGGMLITSAGMAFAAEGSKNATASQNTMGAQHSDRNNGMKMGPGGGERSGAENITSDSKCLTDLMDGLIGKGIITDAQATSIENYIDEQNTTKKAEAEAKREAEQKSEWDSYVTAGLITQTEEDAVLAYYEAQQDLRETEAAKIKAMTETERTAYFESKKESQTTEVKDTEKKSPLSALVDASILTQAQVDSITSYSSEKALENRKTELAEKLDSLVTAGTITSAQETSVITYLTEKKEITKQDETATASENTKTTSSSNKGKKDGTQKSSQLKELVDEGTITQAQADAIIKVLFQQSEKNLSNK